MKRQRTGKPELQITPEVSVNRAQRVKDKLSGRSFIYDRIFGGGCQQNQYHQLELK